MTHVRHEPATREHYGRNGDGRDLPDSLCVAWCGAVASGDWFFLTADHALNTMQRGGMSEPDPCRACLRRMYDVIDLELHGSAVDRIVGRRN